MIKQILLGSFLALLPLGAAEKSSDEAFGKDYGYSDCVKLENKNTRAIISGACGGRILEYSLDGVNALYLDPAQDGWTYTPGKPLTDPSGGRMDLGPEYAIPEHLDLWLGRWKTERTGPLSVRLTSLADQATGVQLVRDFVLSPDSPELKVTQIIRNISGQSVRWFHWSRTLVPSGGICIVPLTPGSPFPNQYVAYETESRISYRPSDERIVVRDSTLFVTAPPRNAKIGIISESGKLGYFSRNNLLFTKEFPVYPDRFYGDLVPMNVSVCYQSKACELEPIAPREEIKPGGSVSYTETWSLASHPFPADGALDFTALRHLLK